MHLTKSQPKNLRTNNLTHGSSRPKWGEPPT